MWCDRVRKQQHQRGPRRPCDALTVVEIPAAVRAKALAAGVTEWLAALPTLVAQLEQWGLVERVSTSLLLTQLGVQPVGDQMLAAADRTAQGYPRKVPRSGRSWPTGRLPRRC